MKFIPFISLYYSLIINMYQDFSLFPTVSLFSTIKHALHAFLSKHALLLLKTMLHP